MPSAATTSLQGHPSSVPEARRWTVTTLTSWGLGVTAWTAAQVVSELDVTTGTPVTPALLVEQGYYYRDAFRVFREHADDCLRRELVEEVDEVGIGPLDVPPHDLHFTHVRTVVEGPAPVPGMSR